MTKSTGSEAFRSRRTCEPLARELTAPACPATQWALHRERAVERRDAVAESAQTAALEQRRLRRWRRRCTCNGPQSRSTRKSERTERWGTLFGLRQTCAYRPPMTSIAVIGSGTSARRSGRRGGALNGRLVIARRATSAPSACIARTCTPGFAPARSTRTRVQHARLRDVRRPNGGGEVAGPLLVRAQGRRRRAADRRRRLATGARRRHRRDRRRRRRPALADTRDPRGLAALRPAPFSARSRCAAREPVTVTRFCGARPPTAPDGRRPA